MFRGANAISLDAKGRLAMPSRYRDELVSRSSGQLIVTIDAVDPCLCVYPLDEWEIIETKLRALRRQCAQFGFNNFPLIEGVNTQTRINGINCHDQLTGTTRIKLVTVPALSLIHI